MSDVSLTAHEARLVPQPRRPALTALLGRENLDGPAAFATTLGQAR